MRSEGASGTGKPGGAAAATALVVGEIALTVVLLTAASLLLRSYAAVLAVDPGFDAGADCSSRTRSCRPRSTRRSAATRGVPASVLERVSALPGVAARRLRELPAAHVQGRPNARQATSAPTVPAGAAPEDILRRAADRFVTGDYLARSAYRSSRPRCSTLATRARMRRSRS